MLLRMTGQPDKCLNTSCALLDGHDNPLLNWIVAIGVVAITSDNLAVESCSQTVTRRPPRHRSSAARTLLVQVGRPPGRTLALGRTDPVPKSQRTLAISADGTASVTDGSGAFTGHPVCNGLKSRGAIVQNAALAVRNAE
jgi:hypothetical protein